MFEFGHFDNPALQINSISEVRNPDLKYDRWRWSESKVDVSELESFLGICFRYFYVLSPVLC